MSNWKIVPQEKSVDGDTIMVECKRLEWRPASDKEIHETECGPFKKIGHLTYRVCFKHNKDNDNEFFRAIMQYRNDRWQINLHNPDRLKAVEIKAPNRVSCVTIIPDEKKKEVVKSSTGTHAYHDFFNTVLPKRIRDEKIRKKIQYLLNVALEETVFEFANSDMPYEQDASTAAMEILKSLVKSAA